MLLHASRRPVSVDANRPGAGAIAADRIAGCLSIRLTRLALLAGDAPSISDLQSRFRTGARPAGRTCPYVEDHRGGHTGAGRRQSAATRRARAAAAAQIRPAKWARSRTTSCVPDRPATNARRLPPPNPSSTNRPTSDPHSTALVNSATKATFGLTYDHAVSRRHRQPHANDAAVPSPCPIRPGAQTYAQTYATLSGIDRYRTRRSVGSTTGVTPRGSGAALRPGVIALN